MTAQDLLIAFQSKATAKSDYFVISAGEVVLTQLDQDSVSTLLKSGVNTIPANGVDIVVYEYLKSTKGTVAAEDMQKASLNLSTRD